MVNGQLYSVRERMLGRIRGGVSDQYHNLYDLT